MNTSKLIVTLLLSVVAAYTILLSTTQPIGSTPTLCKNRIISAILPWSAGCLFEHPDRLTTMTDKEVASQMDRLSNYVDRGGMDSEILWYRLRMYIHYSDVYKIDFQRIHHSYLDYLKADHKLLGRHADYLKFLVDSDLAPLAQSTFNDYCDVYASKRKQDVLPAFRTLFEKLKVTLDFSYCEASRARYQNP